MSSIFRMTVGAMFLAVVSCLPISAADPGDLPATIEFNRDIRPILSDNCFFCHGPDKNKRQADLRLDTEAGLSTHPTDPSKPGAVVASKPAESELMRRITTPDPQQVMPPIESGKKLSPNDIAVIRKWIEQGAKYEGHWSFLSIKRPAPSQAAALAPSQMIDEIIRQKLTEMHLQPGAAADRVMLIRRLSFDLTGLPPTPEQVQAFVDDHSSGAYERVVDRLLASPHFGERLAIWWLDLVRYADSVGYHGDQDVSVSPFRQYVIDSFNSNKRFDQFTTEQLAGDLLPTPTLEQKIASGYNRLGMMSAEGGVQDKEYLAKYIAERVRNASGAWLGVTLGCAECHDHKYDPFTTRDFYRFEAFFADIQERGLYAGSNDTGSWGSSVKVPTKEQARQVDDLQQQIENVKKVLATATPELAAAQVEWEKSQISWTVIKPDKMTSANGATLTLKDDGSVLATGNQPATDTYTLTFKDLPTPITAIRLEALTDDSLVKQGPGRASNGNFVLTEFSAKLSSEESVGVGLQNATASHEQAGGPAGNTYGKWAIASTIDPAAKGKNWGWAVMEKVGQPQTAVFETKQDLVPSPSDTLTVTLLQNFDHHALGRIRFSVTSAPRPVRLDRLASPQIATILRISAEQRTDAQRTELATFYRTIAPALEPTRQQLANLERNLKELDGRITSTLMTVATAPRMVRVLKRGNWMDDSGEVVNAAFPAILTSQTPTDAKLTRLDLAQWITAKDNPLTARVFANRVWKVLFGAGLSRRVDDLGAQGDWPSHPALLDGLATHFIDSGWDVKGLIKTIVMSKTYQQTSLAVHELRDIDPYNRWLARQGRFRVDAEFVRDNALAISGLLVNKFGGTSVKPYQPPGYWAHLNFPMREWQNGSGEDLYRRGLYTHWQRQYLHPSLLAFDAPSREECTADRARSNTPLQSLVLLNDPTYVEAARAFAELILRHGGSSIPDRLNFAFRRAVSRNSTEAESKVLEQLLAKHLNQYKAEPKAAAELLSVGAKLAATDLDKAELAAWTDIARVILNLHETMTRN